MNKYPHLFERLTIRNVTFRNRIFSAPCAITPSGRTRMPDEEQMLAFEHKAMGGAAVVTVSETMINLKYAPRKLNMGNVAVLAPEWSGYREWIKEAYMINRMGAVPSVQLSHAGDVTKPAFIKAPNPIGPNDFVRADGVHIIGMDEALMEETIHDFAEAAKFMKDCGFKMIMLHGGHGWLLSQFISPATNHRTDEYGGSLENRARFPLRVLKAIREAVGEDFVIDYRISGDDHVEGGITLDDVCEFAKMAEEYVDIFDISAGSYYSSNMYMFPGIFVEHGCNLHLAKAVKKAVKKAKVAAVGAFSDPVMMEKVLADGDADIIYMARQLLADPETPNKWRTGREDDVVKCVRCNNCLGNYYKGIFGCDVNPEIGHELYNLNMLTLKDKQKRKVVIVGGGPAGLSAALTAKKQGHDVILLEKEGRLGGTLNYLEHDVHKYDLIEYKNHMIYQVEKNGVDIRLNTEATKELIESLNPDYVLCAVGAESLVPPIPGLKEFANTPKQVAEFKGSIGDKVVLIGGGLSGAEMGISYAKEGHHVTVIEMGPEVAAQANHLHKPAIHETIDALKDNITCLVNTKCVGVKANGVEVEGPNGKQFVEADYIINVIGVRQRFELVDELGKANVPMFNTIGDCRDLKQVRGAVHSGYCEAMNIR